MDEASCRMALPIEMAQAGTFTPGDGIGVGVTGGVGTVVKVVRGSE